MHSFGAALRGRSSWLQTPSPALPSNPSYLLPRPAWGPRPLQEARLEQSLVKGTSVAAAAEAVAQQRRADPLWCPPQQACGLCPPCRQVRPPPQLPRPPLACRCCFPACALQLQLHLLDDTTNGVSLLSCVGRRCSPGAATWAPACGWTRRGRRDTTRRGWCGSWWQTLQPGQVGVRHTAAGSDGCGAAAAPGLLLHKCVVSAGCCGILPGAICFPCSHLLCRVPALAAPALTCYLAAHAAQQERRAQEKRQEKLQHGSKYWQTVQHWRRQQLEEGGKQAKQSSDSSSSSSSGKGSSGGEEGEAEAGGGSPQAVQPPRRRQQQPQQEPQQQGQGQRVGGAPPPQPEADPAVELDWLEQPPRATLARRHMLEQREEQVRRPLRQQLGWEAARFAAALEQEQQPGAMAAGGPAAGPRKGRGGAAGAAGPADGGQQHHHGELLDPGSWLARAVPPGNVLQGQRPTDLLQLAALCRQG